MSKFTEADLIKQTAYRTGMSQKDTEKMVNEFINLIADVLSLRHEVSITGFIKLTPHKVGERTYHMPGGGTVISPARTRIGVRFSKTLKAKINK